MNPNSKILKTVLLLLSTCMLASCGGLEKKATQLEIGNSRSDVAKVMGPPPYQYTYEKVDAWRYAVVAGIGYCDYREFYIYRDTLIYKNEYHNGSIAGCTVGLRQINWQPILLAAQDHDKKYPAASNNEKNLVEQLKELSRMKENGSLNEEEYLRAKSLLLKN